MGACHSGGTAVLASVRETRAQMQEDRRPAGIESGREFLASHPVLSELFDRSYIEPPISHEAWAFTPVAGEVGDAAIGGIEASGNLADAHAGLGSKAFEHGAAGDPADGVFLLPN